METKELNITNLHTITTQVLDYYSIFKYPLKDTEILGSLSEKCSLHQLRKNLQELTKKGHIYEHKGYYSLLQNIVTLVERREAGNRMALVKIKKAKRAAGIINCFPFVRFVGISGSLSKGYAEQESDFDFFIVTASSRLWICRTLLHLFKKFTFLTGSQDQFCMNYFVDTEKIEIEEKNKYTATELASLIPVHGAKTYEELINSNKWIQHFFPNGFTRFCEVDAISDRSGIIKTIAETGINIFSANKLNKLLMKFTDKKWRKKWDRKNYPAEDYELAFKTTLHVSKNHPANYQKKILKHLSQNNVGHR